MSGPLPLLKKMWNWKFSSGAPWWKKTWSTFSLSPDIWRASCGDKACVLIKILFLTSRWSVPWPKSIMDQILMSLYVRDDYPHKIKWSFGNLINWDAPPLNLENYIEICLILFQNLKYDNKSAITFLGLSPKKFLHPPSKKNPYIFPKNHHLHRQKSAQKILDWKWLPPIWKLSRNLSGLVWVAVPNVYLPNLIYTSLFIYLLSAASRLYIYQILLFCHHFNQPTTITTWPTNQPQTKCFVSISNDQSDLFISSISNHQPW